MKAFHLSWYSETELIEFLPESELPSRYNVRRHIDNDLRPLKFKQSSPGAFTDFFAGYLAPDLIVSSKARTLIEEWDGADNHDFVNIEIKDMNESIHREKYFLYKPKNLLKESIDIEKSEVRVISPPRFGEKFGKMLSANAKSAKIFVKYEKIQGRHFWRDESLDRIQFISGEFAEELMRQSCQVINLTEGEVV